MAQKRSNKIINDLKPTLSLHVYGLLEGAWPLTRRLIIVLNFLSIGLPNGRLSPSQSRQGDFGDFGWCEQHGIAC